MPASLADSAGRNDWHRFADSKQTLIIYMGARRLAEICTALIEAGRDIATPAAVIMQGTTGAQRVVGGALAEIAARCRAAGISAPAVLIIGSVASLAGQLAWYEGESAGTGKLPDQPVQLQKQ